MPYDRDGFCPRSMFHLHRNPRIHLGRRRIGALAWALALGCVLPAAVAQTPWLITITDGSASVIESSRRVEAVVGYKASAGAIVETAAEAALVRLESEEEVSIDLGPATQAMIDPPNMRRRDGSGPRLYLLQGWAKVSRHGTTRAPAVRTPLLDVGASDGVVVLQVAGRDESVFVESGRSDLAVRKRRDLLQPMGAGQFFKIAAAAVGSMSPRPPLDWIAQVPPSFRDPIPLRAHDVKGAAPKLVLRPPLTYAELAPWLNGEPELRRPFPRRFATLAGHPEFRRGLEAQMSEHPEWNPVLHPPPPPEDAYERSRR